MLSLEKGTEPLVSVIIPTFKRPDTLDRAVNSVLNQTYSNIEVIVVDDNNSDTEGRALTEAKMVQFINEPRVKYVRHPYNMNGSAARNTGAKNAEGKYLAFLDDDDEFLPAKIASQVSRLQELSEDYALCYSRYFATNGGKHIPLSTENREGDLYEDALVQSFYVCAGSNLLVRKDAFDAVGGFDIEFKRNQDVEVVVRLLKKYKIAYTPIVGLIIHVHHNHSNVNHAKILDFYICKFKSAIDELPVAQRASFNKMVVSEKFFYYLRVEHNYSECLHMIRRNDISFCLAITSVYSHSKQFIYNLMGQ